MAGSVFAALRDLVSDKKGGVGITFGLTVLPAMFAVGLAVDYGRVVSARQKLQTAVDTAALAAISKLTDSEQSRIALAEAVFRENMANSFVAGSVTPVVSVTATGASVSAAGSVSGTFSKLARIDSFSLSASASVRAKMTTTSGKTGRACVLALQASNNGWGFYTNSSTIDANCGLFSNVATSNSFDANGDSKITSTFTCTVGNVEKDRDVTFTPAPRTGCTPLADPFSGLSRPSNHAAACNYTKKKVDGNSTAILSPGVYCEGLEIGSSAKVTFLPGIYVIRDGAFNIGSSAVVSGLDVFFYLKGANSRFDWGSSVDANFKGRITGDYKGMLLWHDYANSNQNKFGCHSMSIVQGAIYSPSTGVEINSNGTVGASADWTVWVVKWLQLGSSSGLAVTSNFAASTTPMPAALENGGLVYTLEAGSSTVTSTQIVE